MKKMTDISEEGIALLMATGFASGMLFEGRMLARKAGDEPVAPHAQRVWGLYGALHEFMFDAALSQEVRHSATHLHRSNGLSYLVFAQTTGDWQHRLVLPLVGEEAREFLRSARTQPVRFSLADGPRRLALLHEDREQLSTVLPEESCVLNVPADIGQLVDDIKRVATQAMLPWFMPELGSPTPLTCVSYIHPPALLESMARSSSRAPGHT
ncbi:hypothetical protein D9M68_796580 [compost metagenome]